jgi:signal transduction histidine kinase
MRVRACAAWQRAKRQVGQLWSSPRGMLYRERAARVRAHPLSGWVVLAGGTAFMTLLVAAIDQILVPLPNPGIVYLPFVAMIAYYWDWRFGLLAGLLDVACVYVFFITPVGLSKELNSRSIEQLVALVGVTAFMLLLVQLASSRRQMAEREAGRFAALSSIGVAMAGERDEARLLHLIAQTARDLTGAEFAAFTLRPVDAMGQPLVPAEGNLFHLAAVEGVTEQQEALFRRMPLGGEGLLAPIFRQGVPVRLADALELSMPAHGAQSLPLTQAAESRQEAARRSAITYAQGSRSQSDLIGIGVPRGHPIVRSFLGAPLLDHQGEVRGGLLLGHSMPDRFTHEHEDLLLGLAAEAAVAIENVRLYQSASAQARELDTIFESLAEGLLVLDAHGRVVRENDMARRMRADLAVSDSASALGRLLDEPAARALAGQPESVEPVQVLMAGEPRDLAVSASLLRLDAPMLAAGADVARRHTDSGAQSAHAPLVVVVWHDVTEARRIIAERRARSEAEARWKLLQLMVDEMPSGVYLVRGTDARLILANRAAAEVWGARWPEDVPMAEFLATSGTRIFSADGKLLEGDELQTLRALRSAEPVQHQQENIRRPDGVTLPILYNAVTLDPTLFTGMAADPAPPDPSAASEPVALVVLQDMSAIKEAERLKDEFIAIAAHELRNPMTTIKGYADMLRAQSERGAGQPLEDWQLEAITAIDQSTGRLVELTEDLLDVTRLQAGRLELHVEPHDLVALARRVAKRLQVSTQQHTLRVHCDAPYVVVRVDVKRMEQVLTNLVSNAIKYSPRGGTIDITICETPAEDSAMLAIRDHGIGIPEAQRARIFGRFERAQNAREFGITGTGLGLFLSRELVVRHGGRIWFESVEGQGTTFFLTVPLAQHDDDTREPPDREGGSQNGGHHDARTLSPTADS